MMNKLLQDIYGSGITVKNASRTSGGCINNTMLVELSDGRNVFVKQNSLHFRNMFRAEAYGLELLKRADTIRVPNVIAVRETDKEQYLFLEYINQDSRKKGFLQDFGEKLARLHMCKLSDEYGLDSDNFIGSTEQENKPSKSWTEFFAVQRLLYQIKLAESSGKSTRELSDSVRKIIADIKKLLPEPDHPSLLHGDLWGGNYMTDENGEAVLIDPAVYYGHNEADLAMTELFGGFGSVFYDSYNSVLHIDKGYKRRKNLYNLYHILNHLNLFGGSYLGQCISICRYFV